MGWNMEAALIDDALKTYLEKAPSKGWIEIDTLARLVGAPLEMTRGLLIECEARGSVKKSDPPRETWSLVKRNPLFGEED